MRLRRTIFAIVAFACASAPLARASAEGPSITLDDFLARHEQVIDEILDAQIARLRQLLALTSDDDPLKPDLWFRLGDLCDEKRRAAFASAQVLGRTSGGADP
jgi:hypothetical protein